MKIKLTNIDTPDCPDGCCHKEIIILDVAGKRFEYDSDFMCNKDAIEQYEIIIKDLLSSMKINYEIITNEL